MMNLTRQDRQVINNFSLFNKNLEFKKDLRSISSNNNLIAEYKLESDEFNPFVVYETPEFLKCYNSFLSPKVEILKDRVLISDHKSEVKFFTAERAICRLPKKTISELIKDKIPDTQLKMSFDNVKSLQKFIEILKLPNLVIKQDDDNFHSFLLTDLRSKKSNEFSISTYQKTNKDYYCKVPHFYTIPLLISNYKVSIFDDEYILLESLDIPLKYLIALEPKPQPDSKEREIIKYYAENQKRYD